MIARNAASKIDQLASVFKSVAITGPRQSGKTTLAKSLFPDKTYLSLENPDVRRFALEDPRGFLSRYQSGAVFDEVQRAPELFSYLQEILDESPEPGRFILTGSNNFLLQQNISQTLAGRVAILNLLPFSTEELFAELGNVPDENELIFNGLYPPIYEPGIPPADWFPNYLRTYIDRDVRQIKNITDLIVFERFVRLLAGRNGQELNLTSLAVDTGVDTKTVQSWIGILESSFIIYLLRPHYKNFNKTLVKRPKVYFYDTGLVCSLLGISNAGQVALHPLRGALFESLVVTELVKQRTNAGKLVNLYYWRDKTGHEVDIIVDNGLSLIPVEIKAGKTVNNEFFSNMTYWNKLSGAQTGYIAYAGNQTEERSNGINVLNWFELLRRNV
ncbi:ATP-binding protein [Dyadobacter fermentans]|uniref:AAA+ superfamily protein n=1 Tax=Dyadobacter fermentans (strain ATCC 700827 / DSM 18053 / CIP 107007 / KCTC 52180 / NS114) TaxID=471854 RepID=C6VS20_DYAFD|nr:ATP-binding protein [Dyadobacter fermentans]ACT94541.1 AAA+ superfamily protein [Dyadobacter fermentans DSM 18053]